MRTTTPNRMGKKFAAAVAASVLVIGASACGSDDDTDDPVDDPADVTETIPVDSALEPVTS